ncbi:MAG TPA: sulfotransferase domain-containing protein [Terriglobales bacterium]|nr:sulfotransferase domain-containing protein [Terriglobales bacterium]
MKDVAEISRQVRTLADRLGWLRARVALGQATSEKRLVPSWIVVGAQRSGTSSLYEYLVAHPLVRRAATEEIHFFDNNYHRGMAWYRGHFATRMSGRFLSNGTAEPVTGEATPYYLAHPLALQRIAKDLPKVKILIVLRNPVDRAFSHFNHERNLGREPLASFEEALDREPERLKGEVERIIAEQPSYYSYAHQNFSYVARGHYAEQISRVFDLFPRENVMVMSSERLTKEAAQVYAEILEFVGLPQHTLRRFPHYSALRYPPMSKAARERLQSIFAPGNDRLFQLLNSDFGWE